MRLNVLLTGIGMLMAVSIANAQQPVTEYKLTVTPQEADQIGNGLGSLPYKDVFPLIQKLRAQILEQSNAALTATPPAASTDKSSDAAKTTEDIKQMIEQRKKEIMKGEKTEQKKD